MHRNAPLTPEGRLRLCHRIVEGWTVAAAAESMNISRQCAHKWWRRYQDAGEAGLVDRSSRPHTCPHQTPARLERRIVALRQARRLGPARLAGIVGVPPSTVHRILVRHGLTRLAWMDRPTGRVVRRIDTVRPGELVHIDVKKLARIPPGGGHKKRGRAVTRNRPGLGYTYIHTAIDAYSRRIVGWQFAAHLRTELVLDALQMAIHHRGPGADVELVAHTDRGSQYTSMAYSEALEDAGILASVGSVGDAYDNAMAESFVDSFKTELIADRVWRSRSQLELAIVEYVAWFNTTRLHESLGDLPPAEFEALHAPRNQRSHQYSAGSSF